MARGKITKRTVDALSAGATDQFIWDEALRGFGLKVTKAGSKTYFVQYRMGGRGAATKRVTIGGHGSPWTPETARREAGRLLSLVSQGVDPRELEKARQLAAVDLAFDAYVERYLRDFGRRHWRPSTYPGVESNLRRFAVPVLRNKPLPDIERGDLTAIFDRIPAGKPALPRNVYAHVSKVFSWALERGDIDRSPFEGFKAPPAVASRERVLTDDELAQVWRASLQLSYPFGPIIRLLMLTGQRREEVTGLQWGELNRADAEWLMPGDRSKNGRAHTVPLSPLAVAEIESFAGPNWPRAGFVFSTTGTTRVSGHSRAKSRLDRLIRESTGAELPPWRLHDLRRTLATGLQKLGVRFEVTEAVLNHVSGARSGVAGVYQRHTWTQEKRAALDDWSAHLAKVVE
jgi:integrase